MTAEERKQQVCVTSLTIILCLKKTSAKLHLPLTTDLFVKDQNTMMQSEDHDKKQICKYSCSSLSQLLHTNVNAVLLFLTSCCKRSLYISSGDLMDCRVIHICYLPNGLLLSASLYSVSFRRALHSSSSGVTSGGMSPSMT